MDTPILWHIARISQFKQSDLRFMELSRKDFMKLEHEIQQLPDMLLDGGILGVKVTMEDVSNDL